MDNGTFEIKANVPVPVSYSITKRQLMLLVFSGFSMVYVAHKALNNPNTPVVSSQK